MKKIRDLYKCEYVRKPKLSSLDIWYNQVIDKDYKDVNVGDILIMFRQNIFIDFAMRKTISMLCLNPLEGEMYEGELLETIVHGKFKQYLAYRKELIQIISGAEQIVPNYQWLSMKEKNEYVESIEQLKEELFRIN